jgi:hypothetical protein
MRYLMVLVACSVFMGCYKLTYTPLIDKNISVVIMKSQSSKIIYLKIKAKKPVRLLVKCNVAGVKDNRIVLVDKEVELHYKVFMPGSGYNFNCKYYAYRRIP